MSEKNIAQSGFFISSILKKAWTIFKEEWIIIYALLLLPVAANIGYIIVAGGFIEATDKYSSTFDLPLYLIYIVVSVVISMGVVKGLLSVIRGEKVTTETFTSLIPLVLNYIVVEFLMTFIILGGFLLFIIPGFYFSLKYLFAPYLVIDKGLGPIEALKESGELTKGVKWDILGFVFSLYLLMYIGVFGLVVGLIITIPVAIIGYVLFYEELLKRQMNKQTK